MKTNRNYASGSITVEASLVVPILLFIVAAFLSFFIMTFEEMKLQAAMQKGLNCYIALSSIGKALGVDLSEVEAEAAGNTLRTLAVREVVLSECGQQMWEQEGEAILSGQNGILMTVEEQESHGSTYLLLTAVYRWNITVLPGLHWTPCVSQVAIASPWEGRSYDEAAEEEGEYVYVTTYGTVYHLYPDCRYLDITLYPLAAGELECSRNRSGEKYYACEYCSGNREEQPVYYVTAYGTAYHSDLGCSRITRDVSKILRQTTSLPACSLCAAREGE